MAARIQPGDEEGQVGDRSGSRLREEERVVEVSIKATGLGSTVARKIIDLHGGRLTLSNGPDSGAIATVTFKLK